MDVAALEDLFAPATRVAVRRMFGGHGIYADGMMFGLQARGAVYLRTDAETEPAFREAGSQPFTYDNGPRTVVLPYWLLPEDAYEDPDVLRRWVALGRAAAARHAATKAARIKPATTRKPAGAGGRRKGGAGRNDPGQATSE